MALVSMADPDLQIRGGPGHPDPEITGEGRSLKKKFFPALRTSVWSKNKGGRALRGPTPGSVTECLWNSIDRKTSFTFLKR